MQCSLGDEEDVHLDSENPKENTRNFWEAKISCIIALESHPSPEYQSYFPWVTNDRVGEGVFFGGAV